jgi:hypothetical protein
MTAPLLSRTVPVMDPVTCARAGTTERNMHDRMMSLILKVAMASTLQWISVQLPGSICAGALIWGLPGTVSAPRETVLPRGPRDVKQNASCS